MSAKSDNLGGRGWAYTSAVVGAIVSVAANVAHCYVPPILAPSWWPHGKTWDPKAWAPQTGAVLSAVWWPIALLLAVEVLARVVWPSGARWVALRYAGLMPLAAVAAIVSYKHLSALLGYYGEDYLTAHIGPLAVDGLMVMATGALIATAGHGRGHDADTATDTASNVRPNVADTSPDSTPDTQSDSKPRPASASTRTPKRTGKRTSTPDTGAAVAKLRDAHPDWSAVQIAERLKVSDRTVRRHLNGQTQTPATVAVEHANGRELALAGADGQVSP